MGSLRLVRSEDDVPGLFKCVFMAARAGCLLSLREMLSFEDVDKKDESGATPLMLSAWHGKTSAFRLLLEKGANPRVRNRHGSSVLMFAARHSEILKEAMFTTAILDVSCPNERGETPLMSACLLGVGKDGSMPGTPKDRAKCIELLAKGGAWVDAAEERGMTALMYAARSGSGLLTSKLLEAGARRDICCLSGKRAVDYAKGDALSVLLEPKLRLV